MIFKKTSVLRVVTLTLLVIFSSARAPGQNSSTGPRGFVRLVNAVAIGTGKLDMLIDGIEVREEGYKFGDVTGGIPRKPGAYQVSFRREGVKSGQTKVLLEKNETTTLIPFAELIPATPDKEAYWTIRILRLKQHENKKERTATIINVTRSPELKVEIRQKDGTWEALFVKRLGLERTVIQQSTGYLPLRSGGKDLESLSVGNSGNFVAVVYEDANGTIRSQNFQDFKYLSAE